MTLNPNRNSSLNATLNPDWALACQAVDASRAPVGRVTGGLTKRQRDALLFIEGYIGTHGYSPNFREIRDGIGLKSNASIYRIASALQERGFIARRYARRRSITLLRPA